MFDVQKYRYSGICEHYSIIVWKCKIGVGEEVGREGKTEDGRRDGRRKERRKRWEGDTEERILKWRTT
jgi:hypothetical protein